MPHFRVALSGKASQLVEAENLEELKKSFSNEKILVITPVDDLKCFLAQEVLLGGRAQPKLLHTFTPEEKAAYQKVKEVLKKLSDQKEVGQAVKQLLGEMGTVIG